MFKLHKTLFICLMVIYMHTVATSYVNSPQLFNTPLNSLAFAAPIPCDSPALEGYGAAAFAKPLLFASYSPANYAPLPQINYAAPPTPSYVKYGAQPRIKATTGVPVTTTFTTAVGFAAPQIPNFATPLAFASQNNAAAFVAPAPSYAAPVSYATHPAFVGSTSYATPTLLAAQPYLKKFRAPFPAGGNVYAQGAMW